MWFKIIFILFFASVLTCDLAFAQEPAIETDSTHLYENKEDYSKQSKFTKFMYGLFFKPVSPNPKKKDSKKIVYEKLKQKPYSAFEGKIIRHINIETLDPFGKTIGDTMVASHNFFIRTGNKLHIKSQETTIRNLLIIHQNQPLDSLLVKESERLVRNQSYVRDVSFFVKPVSKNSDSVDIYIRELDTWTIIPAFASSTTSNTIRLTERNFLGYGHEFKNSYTWFPETGDDAFVTKYFVPNIRNTYINTTLIYGTDELRNSTKSLSVDRPCF
jgi:outer membrane protein assembly factor BamA